MEGCSKNQPEQKTFDYYKNEITSGRLAVENDVFDCVMNELYKEIFPKYGEAHQTKIFLFAERNKYGLFPVFDSKRPDMRCIKASELYRLFKTLNT